MLLEHSQVVLQDLLMVSKVEFRVVSPAVKWLDDAPLLIPVLAKRHLFVEAQIPLVLLDLVAHVDLLAAVDLGHLLAVLLRDCIVEHLPRILLLLRLLVFVVIKVGRLRVQIYVWELIEFFRYLLLQIGILVNPIELIPWITIAFRIRIRVTVALVDHLTQEVLPIVRIEHASVLLANENELNVL